MARPPVKSTPAHTPRKPCCCSSCGRCFSSKSLSVALIRSGGSPGNMVTRAYMEAASLLSVRSVLPSNPHLQWTPPSMHMTEPEASGKPQLADQNAWLHDAVIYEIYVRSFLDSDGDGVGDLPGVVSRLEHIASL